jgi:hypothetical protein
VKKSDAAGETIAAALTAVEFARRDELASTMKQRWSEASSQDANLTAFSVLSTILVFGILVV